MSYHRVYKMLFAKVYPLLLDKVERKDRTKEELDEIICWLTGYDSAGLQRLIDEEKDMETFIIEAPALNPKRKLIKGVVCGVRVEEVKEPLMRELRYMDKMIEELARGRAMEKILRQ
ncbi:MAG: DUF2200 domain-containing protein [Verrucomicrobiales bacterium]|nr:DUF2200 domain-containing protein [Verrucomicrobiales bacterium]